MTETEKDNYEAQFSDCKRKTREEENCILSFDDGPCAETTPKVLEIFEEI